jgi:endoglycosylceramidase
MLAAIRGVDTHSLVWYEPQVLFNYGSKTNLPALGDPRLGFAFHNYCLEHDFHHTTTSCQSFDDLVFQQALDHVASTHDALMETEFGATTDPQILIPDVRRSDRDMVSWLEWHYCGCMDPTTSGPGSEQAIVIDPRKPPTGSNLVPATLRALVEPYPQVIAGTPESWGFDRASKTFTLRFGTARVGGGGRFGSGAVTEIAAPALVYGGRYAARVTGGAIASAPGAAILKVAACPGATSIAVTVTPSGQGRGSCPLPARRRRRRHHHHRRHPPRHRHRARSAPRS